MEDNQHSRSEGGHAKKPGQAFDFSKINLDNNIIFGLIIIAILLLNIYLRTGLLGYEGVFEPDGFFYLSVIQQTLANHLVVPTTSSLSGFPNHNMIGESPGLIYMTVAPYLILQFFGLTPYDVMRYMPMLFGILGAVAAYYLVKYLYNSKALGLLAMLFISVSSGNIARTAGGVYRGDSFVGLLIILALMLMLKTLLEPDQRKRIYFAVALAFVVSLSLVVWNGGILTTIIYMAALLLLLIYAFIIVDNALLKNLRDVTLALLLVEILDTIYPILGLAHPGAIFELNFFVFFIPIMAAVLIARFLVENKGRQPYSRLVGSAMSRALVLFVGGIVTGMVMYLLFAPIINGFLFNGSVVAGENIAKTTQELQPISYSFLFASFGYQLFIAPIGIIIFLFLSHRFGAGTQEKRHHKQMVLGFVSSLICAFIIILSILWVVGYTFQIGSDLYNLVAIPVSVLLALLLARILGKGNMRAMRLTLNMAPAFLVIMAYLIIVGYLQYNAIRYNALFSVPLALVAAYGVYAAGKVLSEYSIKGINLKYVYAGFIFAIILIDLNISVIQSFASVQADGINPQFLQAMSWLSNNTASNATVLALWPDGSVVEGWGNRQSFMDSVGGENGTRIVNFANWLFNTSPDTQYLYSVYKPQYLVVRNFWFQEMGGIATEGTFGNLTNYGLDSMTAIQIAQNGSEQIYQFGSASYSTEMIITPLANGSRIVQGYVGAASSPQLTPIQQVIFYNTSNSGYSIVRSIRNDTLNFTLMISFSGTNITQASILGPALPYSNIFRLLVMCNGPSYCPMNNNPQNVTFTSVYRNGDSTIYKINYPN